MNSKYFKHNYFNSILIQINTEKINPLRLGTVFITLIRGLSCEVLRPLDVANTKYPGQRYPEYPEWPCYSVSMKTEGLLIC